MLEQTLSELISNFVDSCESTKPIDEELMVLHLHLLAEDEDEEDSHIG